MEYSKSGSRSLSFFFFLASSLLREGKGSSRVTDRVTDPNRLFFRYKSENLSHPSSHCINTQGIYRTSKMVSAKKMVCFLVILAILGTLIVEPVTAHHHHRQGNIVELLAAGIVAKMLSEHKHHGCHHG
ncbi:hypothetical protein CEXT_115891 [Caerostris extrusa]|uniref:Uncharacterized protein n=1 Tax=Caerostris extrusa TaxID=172846 RepID=A0AAV4T767_CAEEX|nr:hypothetical protein CEXT_115891 [Caerostris extrusa]